MSIDRAELERDRIEVFARNNAQDIYKALRKLEEYRERYRTRWLWELIQNARDAYRPGRRMTINIAVSETQIRFRHDGRPFTRKEILSLIYHGSTKTDPDLGKFGTGFLSTHLLSPTVEVAGTLAQEARPPARFRFMLDRSGEKWETIEKAMECSYERFRESAESETAATEEWTEYIYHLRDGSEAALFGHLEGQFSAIPYVLVFESKIKRIDILLPSGRCSFRLNSDDHPSQGAVDAGTGQPSGEGVACPPGEASQVAVNVVTVQVSRGAGDSSALQLAVIRRDDSAVAIPLAPDRPDLRLVALDQTPRLFTFLPLLGTAKLGVPAVFHSASFRPTEERDGLYLAPGGGPDTEANKRLLRLCVDLLGDLAKACSTAAWQDLHELLHVHEPEDGAAPWLADFAWYRELLAQLVERLAQVPLIRNGSGDLLPVAKAVVPLGDSLLGTDVLLRLAAPLYGATLPAAHLANDLASAVERWLGLLGTDHALSKACVLRSSRLLSTVRAQGDLPTLGARLGCEADEALRWLNELIEAVPEDLRQLNIEGLLPDQTGAFRHHAELSRDNGIDEVLKDMLEALGEPVRRSLLHPNIRLMDTAIPRVETEETVFPRVKERLKKRADDPGALAGGAFRATCVAAFSWFACRARWKDLRDSFPVLVLDRDGEEALHRTGSDAPRILVPRNIWPEAARAFWDAFPPRAILADTYGTIVPGETWDSLADAAIVIKRLVLSGPVELTDEKFEWLMLERGLEGEHSVKADGIRQIVVGQLALVGSEEFYEAIRKSQERAARFLRLVLEYVASADPSWRQREDIACECGKNHTIVPCDWLAWVRRREWVPRGKHSERVSTESLAALARRDRGLETLMTQERTQDLLELLGVNVLEQTLLTVDESQRSAMRRKLAELTKLLGNPSEVDDIVKGLAVKREVTERWASNQRLGRRVEELVRRLFDDLKIPVRVHFRGYDLEAYVGALALPEEDVGVLDVGLAKIEIKATRSDSVSLSGVQAESASADSLRYWLAVVPVDADQPLDALGQESVRERIRFVPGIGELLSLPLSELSDAVQVAHQSGLALQHVDGIRYQVGRSVWDTRGVTVEEFVQQGRHA